MWKSWLPVVFSASLVLIVVTLSFASVSAEAPQNPSPLSITLPSRLITEYTGTSDGLDVIQDSFPSTSLVSARYEVVSFDTTFTLTSASFDIMKVGSPVANIVVKVYSIVGTYGIDASPTGSELATSELISTSSLETRPITTNFRFYIPNQITLLEGHKYAFVLLCSDKSTFNTDNCVKVDGYWGSLGANYDGNMGRYGNPAGWNANNNGDLFFAVYGIDAPSTTNTITPNPTGIPIPSASPAPLIIVAISFIVITAIVSLSFLVVRGQGKVKRAEKKPPPNINNDDPYEILGIPRNANREQVKDAWRKLCMKYHPDAAKDKDDTTQELYAKEFDKINKAKEEIFRLNGWRN
jgi:hypothetical protein